MSEEQRKQKRFKVNWSSRLLFSDRSLHVARVRDISSGGLGFEFGEQLPNGTKLNIEFSPLINGKKYLIRAKGEVMFSMILSGSSGFSHGLKFTLIPRDQFEQLSEILKSIG